jgi:hypothetical protein
VGVNVLRGIQNEGKKALTSMGIDIYILCKLVLGQLEQESMWG